MNRTNKNEIIHFISNNLTLEGMLSLPAGPLPVPGAVICHPHPQYGGDMDNNVVSAVGEALEDLGVAVLRFNFRGVNGSEGSFDNGVGEIDDVRAALSFLSAHEGVENDRIVLIGYSFGAFVGLQAALDDGTVKALVGISPPVDIYDFDFLANISVPVLILCGDGDMFCSEAGREKMLAAVAAPKEIVLFPGVDHFYWGQEQLPAQAVRQFVRSHCF